MWHGCAGVARTCLDLEGTESVDRMAMSAPARLSDASKPAFSMVFHGFPSISAAID